MRNAILFIILFSLHTTSMFSQVACFNMDFEQGNTSGWNLYKGQVNNSVAEITNTIPTNIANAQFAIMSGGNDTECGISTVNPFTGNYSLRLGDFTTAGRKAASATRTFLVDNSNANFTYSFAVVLEDPGHNMSAMPFFKVNVYDQAGNMIQCGEYLVVAGTNMDNTWQAFNGGFFRDWHTVFVPLEPYIGTNVTVEFISGDCNHGGHFGYAYIDAECRSLDLIPPGTEICNNETVTLTAPTGAMSYQWNTGSTSENITINTPGTYSVTVTPVQGAMCNAVFSATIDGALGNPTTDFSTDTTLCAGVPFSPNDLSVSTPGSGIGYWNWNFGDGSLNSYTQNTNHSYTSAGTYVIKLTTGVIDTIGNGGGCYDSLTKTVVVQDINADFSSNYVCLGLPTEFSDLSVPSNATITNWEWDFTNDGTIDNNSQNPMYGYLNPGSFDASLIAYTSFGCTDTATNSITVNPLPIPNFTADTVCLGETTTTTNLSTIASGTITNYNWNFNDGGATSNNTNASHIFSNPGTYSISLQVESDSGCTASDSANIYVSDFPTANFLANNVCDGDTVFFQDKSSANNGSIENWSWDFETDGTENSDISNPNNIFSLPGSYNVTLSIENNYGCIDTITQGIEVYDLPHAQFTSHNACEDSSVHFTNLSTVDNGSISQNNWNLGNGHNSNQLNPIEVYTNEGIYPIELITTTDNGCTDTATGTVEIYPTPTALFTNNNNCFGASTVFQDLSSVSNQYTNNNISSWSWDFASNGQSSTAQNPSIIYNSPGSYSATLEITTNNGCKDTVSMPVDIYPNPTLSLSSSAPSGCSEWCVDFENTSTISDGSIANYNWDFGDGYTSNQTDPKQCFTNDTWEEIKYDISLSATSDQGCITDTLLSEYVTVYPNPEANFTTSTNSTSMYTPEIEFYDESIIADEYFWDFAGLSSSTETDPIYSFPDHDSGTYNVCLTVYTDNGCSDIICEPIKIEGESGLFVPNAFTPNGDGKNDYFRPEMHGFETDDFNFLVFDRWGDLIYEFRGDYLDWSGWDGTANKGNRSTQQDVYVWNVIATPMYSFRKVDRIGKVTLLN